jgi:hypothetical protein
MRRMPNGNERTGMSGAYCTFSARRKPEKIRRISYPKFKGLTGHETATPSLTTGGTAARLSRVK